MKAVRFIFLILILFVLSAHPISAMSSLMPSTSQPRITSEQLYYEKALVLEDVFWVYAVETVNISGIEIPEGTTALVIYLKNNANFTVKNITVDFQAITKIAECNETLKSFNDSLAPGYSVVFAFSVSLFENISASEYDLPLYVMYFIENYLYSYEITIPVAVTGVPILKINADPIFVTDEGTYSFDFRVSNIGSTPARRVIATLIPYPPYVSAYGEDWIDLGIIPANSSKKGSFTIYVSQFSVSNIPIVINVTFLDERTDNFYSVAESVPVVYNETPHVILISSSYIPTSVFPGDTFVKISATISNPTRKTLSDVSVQLILPSGFTPSYAGSTILSIGSMVPGQTVSLIFYVNVNEDVPPGQVSLGLEIIFKEGKNTFSIPLIVKEKAEFEITDFNPSTLPIGGRGINFRISIRNIAKVDAESVYIQLMGGTIIKGEIVTYVGKVVSGEQVSVTFTIEISSSAKLGTASIDLKVTWTQESRILVKIYKIYVVLVSGQPSVSGLFLGASLIIAGILAIPILREIRKKFGGGEA